MMVHMRLLLIVFIFLCVSCATEAPHINRYNKIVNEITNKLETEESINVIALGQGRSREDNIMKIMRYFSSYRTVDINESRAMIVKCIETIKDAVNSDPLLIPYLDSYPFPASKIDVNICFLKPSGEFLEFGCVYLGQGGVSLVFQRKNNLFYSSYNLRTGLLEPFYEEPYETALAIVRGEYPETNEDEVRRANKEKYLGSSED